MKNRSEENGSKNDNWKTPPHILKMIRDEFGQFFDPCPFMAEFDGLSIEWGGVNYINPPYNAKDKKLFINKAIEEYKKGKICILLIPASTETQDFKNLWENACEIRFIHKRVKFHGENTKGEWVTNSTGQSGSMIVILKNKNENQKNPIVTLINQ